MDRTKRIEKVAQLADQVLSVIQLSVLNEGIQPSANFKKLRALLEQNLGRVVGSRVLLSELVRWLVFDARIEAGSDSLPRTLKRQTREALERLGEFVAIKTAGIDEDDLDLPKFILEVESLAIKVAADAEQGACLDRDECALGIASLALHGRFGGELEELLSSLRKTDEHLAVVDSAFSKAFGLPAKKITQYSVRFCLRSVVERCRATKGRYLESPLGQAATHVLIGILEDSGMTEREACRRIASLHNALGADPEGDGARTLWRKNKRWIG